jgi:hypothetical protein
VSVFFGFWFTFFSIVNLSMKEGSLFCFVIVKSTEPGCFTSCSWCLWKALDEKGCMRGLGSMAFGIWTCNAKVLEY